MSEPTRTEPTKLEPKRSRLPGWLVLTLTLFMTNVLIYVTWMAGVWIADNIGIWLCWVLGVVAVLVAPLVSAIFGYVFAGRKEHSAMYPGAVVSLIFMMGSLTIAPRLVAPTTICQSSFASAPRDALRCEFLCFPEAEVFPEVTASYATSTKKSGRDYSEYTHHTLLAMGEPGSQGPYTVWVKEDYRESEGLCVWQMRGIRDAIESVRESPNGAPAAIPGEQVEDPAASLALYRRWLFIIVGTINGLAWLFGLVIMGPEARR